VCPASVEEELAQYTAGGMGASSALLPVGTEGAGTWGQEVLSKGQVGYHSRAPLLPWQPGGTEDSQGFLAFSSSMRRQRRGTE
jgi:hypothetical protein